LRLPRRDADLLDDFLHEKGDEYGIFAAQVRAGFLLHDLDAERALQRIVRLNQRADAVLQLRNDLAGAVVRGRVGGEEDEHVEVELDGVAADLHVAFFEDVEEADLDEFVQFGDFVHGEDAAVHARDEAEVERVLGGHARAHGELGRVDFADDVGELGAGGQPLRIALVPRPPGNANLLFRFAFQERLAGPGDRLERVFVNGAAGD